MYSEDLNALLSEGFTRKYAEEYLNQAKREFSNSVFDKEYIKWCHQRGFLAESASVYDINEENIHEYLSDYNLSKLWPINNWTRIWINDKLTLKYMLSNTRYDSFMPRYYYYSSDEGLRKLLDAPDQNKKADADDFLKTLIEKGEFACKPCNGSTSLGFIRLSYENGGIYANGEMIEKRKLEHFIDLHRNYLFTEYIRPNDQFAKYSNHIHTLRVVVLNTEGFNPEIIGGYLRIPHKESGEANYIILDDKNIDQYNIMLDIDFTTGQFGNGKKVYCFKKEDISFHPDTEEKLEGKIEDIKTLRETILGISCRFNMLEWIGFDIGVTDNGFKCMEINSHSGIKYMQIYHPLLINPRIREFFEKKLQRIHSLSKEEIMKRNSIPR